MAKDEEQDDPDGEEDGARGASKVHVDARGDVARLAIFLRDDLALRSPPPKLAEIDLGESRRMLNK